MPRDGGATELIAFDKATVRTYDEDGRMHVAETPITKATVNDYWGAEIPESEKLGLDPKKKYRLLRDPDELKKAVPTANNIPLMIKHIRQSADAPQKDKVVGSLGTDAAFNRPHIRNSLVVWDRDGIDGIEDQSRRELSASYRYDADMTPGTFEGQPYDGVMRNIRFNHVALVPDGRAGSDVLVEDAMPSDMEGKPMHISRKRLMAEAAISTFLTPLLASDAKLPAMAPILAGVTAKTFKKAKPQIVAKLIEGMAGRLAKDADLKGVHDFIDSLDSMGGNEADDMTTVDAEETPEEKEKREKEEKEAKDAKDAEMKAAKEAEDKRARDEETPEAMDMRHAADRAAMDKRMGKDKRAKDAESETAEAKEAREKKEKEEREKERAEDKRANDAAIQAAITTERQRAIDLREAETAVRPYVGTIVMAMDSAEDVFRYALDTLGVKHNGVHPSALRAILDAYQRPGAPHNGEVRLAHDAARAKSFAEMFPNSAKVRILA